MATKTRNTVRRAAHRAKRPTVGARIIDGLEQAIAWGKGKRGQTHFSEGDSSRAQFARFRRMRLLFRDLHGLTALHVLAY